MVTKWLSPFSIHLKLSQHCLLIGYTPIQNRRRQRHPTPVLLPGKSQGCGSLVGCCLWGRTESDMTEVTQQQQQQYKIKNILKNTKEKMGRKRTLVIYRVLLLIIQQNIDEHLCVRKLSQTGQGPSKRTRTMPGVHIGPIVPATISQTRKCIIREILGKIFRKIVTQWQGIISLRLSRALAILKKQQKLNLKG